MKRTIASIISAIVVSAAVSASADEIYRVTAGDTLSRIGKQYGVSYQQIMAANGLSNTTIYVGQVLTIPTGGSPAVVSTHDPVYRDAVPSHTYPSSPSDRFGPPTVPDYRTVEPATTGGYTSAPTHYPATVHEPSGPFSVTTPASCRMHHRGSTYVVQHGDSVRSISKKFDVAFWDLRKENDIMFSRIYPGQVLKIPKREATIGVAF